MRTDSSAYRTGFSIVELLVVIAVITILTAFLGAVFVGAKERAKMATDTSNLRQIGAAAAMYAADNDDLMPLSIRPLLQEGRIDESVCRSQSDPYEDGLMLAWILDIPGAIDRIAQPIPNCTYIGPAEALWNRQHFSDLVLAGDNPGWLVNLARTRSEGSGPMGGRGPYQRLMLDGSVQARTAGYRSIWFRGRLGREGLPFGSYFCDEDAEWFSKRL